MTRINTLKNGSVSSRMVPPTRDVIAAAAFYALRERRRASKPKATQDGAASPYKQASKIRWAPKMLKMSPCKYADDAAAAPVILSRRGLLQRGAFRPAPGSPVMVLPRPQSLLEAGNLLDLCEAPSAPQPAAGLPPAANMSLLS